MKIVFYEYTENESIEREEFNIFNKDSRIIFTEIA